MKTGLKNLTFLALIVLLFSLLVLTSCAHGPFLINNHSSALDQSPKAKTITYYLHDEFIIPSIPSDARKLRIWFEVPYENTYQHVLSIKVRSKYPYTMEQDHFSKNRYVYLHFTHSIPFSLSLTVQAKVQRTSESFPHHPSSPTPSLLENERQSYLSATPVIPIDTTMKEIAQRLTQGESTVLGKVRKIYIYLVNHGNYYKKDPTHLKPSGQGSAYYCLRNGTGNCTDYHALFLSLTRSLGIPSRFIMGSYLPENLNSRNQDVAYHCWVEFHDPTLGWVAADPAYANYLGETKVEGIPAKQFYFGRLDNRRIQFTYGRNLTLTPSQEAGPLNYFAYAYVEVNGQPFPHWKRTLTFDVLHKTIAPRSKQCR